MACFDFQIMPAVWEVKPSPAVEQSPAWFSELGLSHILGRILSQRGIHTLSQAKSFLSPRLSDLLDPFLLPNMERAVERMSQALQERERIMIFGDYDVDGISATSLLFLVLNNLGSEVSYYL